MVGPHTLLDYAIIGGWMALNNFDTTVPIADVEYIVSGKVMICRRLSGCAFMEDPVSGRLTIDWAWADLEREADNMDLLVALRESRRFKNRIKQFFYGIDSWYIRKIVMAHR